MKITETDLLFLDKTFGTLTIVAFAGKTKDKRKAVLALCVCGNFVFSSLKSIKSGNTTSCGCSRDTHLKNLAVTNKKHGMSHSRTYCSWHAMLYRVRTESSKDYPNYGGRGIGICDSWLNFENFFADMGERPEGCTLDRIDNTKGYNPENCKWSTNKEQSNNRRSSKLIEYEGKTKTLSEWAELLNIKISTLSKRLKLYGWSVDKAFTTGIK